MIIRVCDTLQMNFLTKTNTTRTQREECLHNKGWNSGTNTAHVEPPPTPLIKEACNGKSDKYFVKIKLCRYHISITSDLYEFKVSMFDHSETREFLLFIRKLNLTLAATGTLDMDERNQYLCTLPLFNCYLVLLNICIEM